MYVAVCKCKVLFVTIFMLCEKENVVINHTLLKANLMSYPTYLKPCCYPGLKVLILHCGSVTDIKKAF